MDAPRSGSAEDIADFFEDALDDYVQEMSVSEEDASSRRRKQAREKIRKAVLHIINAS